MTTPAPSDPRRAWRAALQAAPDCLGPDGFAAELTDAESEHVAGCARCQAERRLWAEFRDSRPGDDQAAVLDIAAALRRRREGEAAVRAFPHAPAVLRRAIALSSWLQIAALLALTTAVGYGLWDREPTLRTPGPDAPVYRSTSIETVSPHGDLPAAPAVFEWRPLDGAVRYNLRVREVDGAEFWSASSTESLLPVPSDVQLKMVPFKTLIWEVEAVTARGDVSARSAGQRFRVDGRTP